VGNDPIVAEIFRFWPGQEEGPRFETFEIPFERGLTVLGLLRFIYLKVDPSLAFRDFQCGVGICGTCRLKINRENRKSCVALLHPGEKITVEPLHKDRVIRDLVTIFD
jgi:succinate dehydrogenase/fumarate reductase-like Fe-S protein